MIKIRYFYKICSTILSITYSCLAVCGMFFFVQKTINILEIKKIYQETGQYPIEVINPVSLQQLHDIVKDFNGTIIFSEKGKIVLNK